MTSALNKLILWQIRWISSNSNMFYISKISLWYSIGILGGGGGLGGVPLSAPQGGISPPCWQRKWQYIPDFAVISVQICHFKHTKFKTLIFFVWTPPLSNILGGNPEYYVFLCPYLRFLCPYLPLHTLSPTSKYERMNLCWGTAGPALRTLDQRHSMIGSTSPVSWASAVVCKQWICILVYTGPSTPEIPKGRRQLKSLDN